MIGDWLGSRRGTLLSVGFAAEQHRREQPSGECRTGRATGSVRGGRIPRTPLTAVRTARLHALHDADQQPQSAGGEHAEKDSVENHLQLLRNERQQGQRQTQAECREARLGGTAGPPQQPTREGDQRDQEDAHDRAGMFVDVIQFQRDAAPRGIGSRIAERLLQTPLGRRQVERE